MHTTEPSLSPTGTYDLGLLRKLSWSLQVQDVLSAAIPAVTAVVCGTGNPRTTFLLCLGVRGLQAGLACQSLSRRVVLRLLAPLCTIPSLAWGQMLEPSSAVRLLVDLVVKPVLVLLQARLWHPA